MYIASPVHYMYTVLHYYSTVLNDYPNVKYHFVSSIISKLHAVCSFVAIQTH